MHRWHRTKRADLALRACGLFLCVFALACANRLVAMRVPAEKADLISLGLTASSFLAASVGCLLLSLGRHLFDEVEVSSRWRRQSLPISSPAMEELSLNAMKDSSPLIVGRDADGSWTVRESAGMLLGRFASADAADRFAQAERESNPLVGAVTRLVRASFIEERQDTSAAKVRGGA